MFTSECLFELITRFIEDNEVTGQNKLRKSKSVVGAAARTASAVRGPEFSALEMSVRNITALTSERTCGPELHAARPENWLKKLSVDCRDDVRPSSLPWRDRERWTGVNIFDWQLLHLRSPTKTSNQKRARSDETVDEFQVKLNSISDNKWSFG